MKLQVTTVVQDMKSNDSAVLIFFFASSLMKRSSLSA